MTITMQLYEYDELNAKIKYQLKIIEDYKNYITELENRLQVPNEDRKGWLVREQTISDTSKGSKI